MKKFICLILSLLIMISMTTGIYANDKIVVVCVGDSLTNNPNFSDRNYSNYLGNLLGNDYEVYNCGQSGAGVKASRNDAYTKTSAYETSKTLNPDLVIIMLGTNDSANWYSKNDYYTDYKALVQEYKELAGEVLLVTSPTVFPENEGWNSAYRFSNELLSGDIRDSVYQIAREENLAVLDMNTLTKDISSKTYDGVHVNAEGAQFFAQQIYSKIMLSDTKPEFDLDLSGTAPADKSDNALTVTAKNIEEIATETIGEKTVPYISFTGSSIANINISDASVLGLDNMTVEMWAKNEVDDTNGRVLFSISTNKSNATYYAEFTDTNLIVNVNGNTATIPVKDAADETKDYMNEWAHYIFTRSYNTTDGEVTINVYINGENVKTETFTATKDTGETSKKLFFGAPGSLNSQTDYAFKGGISEARVYSDVYTAKKAQLTYNAQCGTYGLTGNTTPEPEPEPEPEPDPVVPTDSDLLLDIDFKDFNGTATSLKDNTGNVNLTLKGTVEAKSFEGSDGGTIKYAEFDKSEANWISVDPGKATVPVTQNPDTTVEFWLKPGDLTGLYSDFFLLKEEGNTTFSSDTSYWAVELSGSGAFYAQALNKQLSPWGNTLNIANKWTHFVLTRSVNTESNKVTSYIYIDGVKTFSLENETFTATLDSNTAIMYFGGNNKGSSNRYNGGMAGIKVYKKILTADEVKENYDSQVDSYTAPKFRIETPEIMVNDSYVTVLPISPVVTDEVIANGMTLTDGENTVAVKDITAVDSTKFNINFGQYLNYGQKIKVWSEALKAYNYFSVSKGNTEVKVTLKNASESEIEKPDGSETLKVKLEIKNNGTATQSYKYSVVARNSKNAAVSSQTASASVAAGPSEPINVTLTNAETATKLYVYVWEEGTTTLNPVYGVPVIFE